MSSEINTHIEYFEKCKKKLEITFWKPSSSKRKKEIEEIIGHYNAAIQALKFSEISNQYDDWRE